jgi:5'-methylthioadenosine phosphorylase
MALVTDYDCWHPSHDAVTVADVVQNLKRNAENAQKIIRAAVKRLPVARTCACKNALQNAILTDLSKVPAAIRTKLDLLLKRYF